MTRTQSLGLSHTALLSDQDLGPRSRLQSLDSRLQTLESRVQTLDSTMQSLHCRPQQWSIFQHNRMAKSLCKVSSVVDGMVNCFATIEALPLNERFCRCLFFLSCFSHTLVCGTFFSCISSNPPPPSRSINYFCFQLCHLRLKFTQVEVHTQNKAVNCQTYQLPFVFVATKYKQ